MLYSTMARATAVWQVHTKEYSTPHALCSVPGVHGGEDKAMQYSFLATATADCRFRRKVLSTKYVKEIKESAVNNFTGNWHAEKSANAVSF